LITPDFVAKLAGLLPPDRIYTDPVDCYAYAYDNTRKIFPPDAVVFPITTAEVQAVVTLCNEFKIPLTPRGRGTGTSGGSLPEQGGVALSLERMLRIINIDPANRVIVAEPGVINQSVQDAARPHGYFWPPDTSSAGYSSIG
jgi:D-lactate dehydrogenase